MYKFIENVEIVGHENADFIKNGFYFAERKKNEFSESFLMPKGFNSLVYELDSMNDIDLILDCKDSYDNREWGRNYEVFEEENCIVVKFTKKTDLREDKTNGKVEFILYLSIRYDNKPWKKNDKWVERHYYGDEERNSPPYRRFAYNALRLNGKKFVFSISKDKSSAIKESKFVFDNLNSLKQQEKSHFFNMLKNENIRKIITNDKISREIRIAYVNAANSLNNLVVESKKNHGIFAGLPWFFQFWARDSLVSLNSLHKINKGISEKILLNYLEAIDDDGRLPNIACNENSLGSADAIGWLFLRCCHIVDKINRSKETISSIKNSMYWVKQSKLASSKNIRDYIKKCNSIISKKEKEYFELLYGIENSAEKSINGLLKFHTKDGFEINEAKETWMDTDFNGDDRKGARIELQALRLNMYKLGFELTQNHKYKVLENTLAVKMKQKFWNGKIIADGMDDWTTRPNLFIAAYAFPELLSAKEWEICFDNSLNILWLEWGGLSTIDKSHELFTNSHTGENPKSYHRGDSWFWLNNLAAIQLNKINKNKFKKYIEKIIDASTEDILWKSCIGCASELSSARELSSRGCFNQAWSNAMYMEMVDEVFN